VTFSELWKRFVWAVYPKRCPGCGGVIRPEDDFCESCRSAFLPVPGCDPGDRGLGSGRTASRFVYAGPAAETIKRYKFRGERDLADIIAVWMRDAYDVCYAGERFDAAVSVPTGESCLDEADFDYNGELAGRFCAMASLPYHPELLLRVRECARQTRFGAAERFENVRGAFSASPEARGLRVLVVDDIITTGATVSECAHALLAAGALSVDAVTAAAAFTSGTEPQDITRTERAGAE